MVVKPYAVWHALLLAQHPHTTGMTFGPRWRDSPLQGAVSKSPERRKAIRNSSLEGAAARNAAEGVSL